MNGERSSGDDDSLSWDSGGRRERRRRLSRSEVHHLLASARRRAILSYLRRHPDRPVEFDALVEACLGDARTEGKRAGRLQVEADLHHVQLPALDDAGVVRYDPDEGTVEYVRAKRLEAQLLASTAIDEADLDEQ